MKTVIVKSIDGYSVVTGFAERPIDPVRTQRVSENKIRESAEYQGLRSEVENVVTQIREGKRGAQVKGRTDALAKIKVLLQAAFAENLQYAPLRPDETELDAATLASLELKFKALKKGEALTVEGEVIPDFRGMPYLVKRNGRWAHEEIQAIGAHPPADAITQPTSAIVAEIEEREELDRVAAMNADEKEKWRAAKAEGLKQRAALLRSTLEIEGDEAALEKARAWYRDQLEKLGGVKCRDQTARRLFASFVPRQMKSSTV